MKIRSYKGPSLEALCEKVNKELGPDAVIMHTCRTKGIGRFLGRRRYELIAAVDDGAADAHLLSGVAKPEDIQNLYQLQAENRQTSEDQYQEIKRAISEISRNSAFAGPGGKTNVPDYARDWDSRFLHTVRSELPEILKSGKTDALVAELSHLLPVEEDFPLRKRNGRPRIIALVGPTGSGKTTTLAKLAANACMEKDLNTGLLTLDTYRVAAIDQVKEYATLLGLELHVAFSASEAARAGAQLSDKDVIFVDTPGRNCRDRAAMTALSGMLQAMGHASVLLTVPASFSRQSAGDVLTDFGILHPDYLVITKIDEVRRFPVFTTAAAHNACPIAFVTNGQRVPQDIKPANALEIAKLVTGGHEEMKHES